MLHLDHSRMLDGQGVTPTFVSAGKYKVEGNPMQPLSRSAAAYLQTQVDMVDVQFRRAVARGRAISIGAVDANFGRGRTLLARDALRAGMVDRIGDMAMAIRLAGASRAPGVGAAAIGLPMPTAAADAKAHWR